MASLYVKELNYKNQEIISVKTTMKVVRGLWVDEMLQWAKEHNLDIKWAGEHTHSVNGHEWHEADFYVSNKQEAIFFLLRWS
jgi:hypothetical protein